MTPKAGGAPKPRRTLLTLGRRGRQTRVFLERGHEIVRVQWTDAGQVAGTQSWPNTPANREAAKAFAEGLEGARREGQPVETRKRTLRELWDGYEADQFSHLRPNSQRIYAEGWRLWELFIGRNFPAEDVTLEMVTKFRRELERRGLAVSTTRESISTAKRVFKWAQRQELIGRNRLSLYEFRVAKEKRQESPAEYRREEFVGILAQLDPARATQWRPHVALALCGYQGRRQHAVLHLQWADVELSDPKRPLVTWRAQWDKMGNEETTPLRAGAVRALAVAREWRERSGYDGPWVLPAGSSKNKGAVYTIQSLWAALQAAEERAGILKLSRRGGHGLRRMLAGDVTELTGDPLLGLHAIGDRDARQAQAYLKKRDNRIQDVFDRLDAAEAAADLMVEAAAKPQRSRNENGAPDEDAPLTP